LLPAKKKDNSLVKHQQKFTVYFATYAPCSEVTTLNRVHLFSFYQVDYILPLDLFQKKKSLTPSFDRLNCLAATKDP